MDSTTCTFGEQGLDARPACGRYLVHRASALGRARVSFEAAEEVAVVLARRVQSHLYGRLAPEQDGVADALA